MRGSKNAVTSISGITLPRNEAHVNCVDKILPSLIKIGIEVFWVLADGRIEVENLWQSWIAR